MTDVTITAFGFEPHESSTPLTEWRYRHSLIQAYRDAFAAPPYEEDTDYEAVVEMLAAYRDRDYRGFLAIDDGDVIGFAYGFVLPPEREDDHGWRDRNFLADVDDDLFDGHTFYLEELGVVQSHRRRGLGSRLLDTTVEDLESDPAIERTVLMTHPRSDAVEHLYEPRDFEPAGWETTVTTGGQKFDQTWYWTRHVESTVEKIIADVERDGDAAVWRYTERFDLEGEEIDEFDPEVVESELEAALDSLDPDELDALEASAERIRRFHREQLPSEDAWEREFPEGFVAGELHQPVQRVACYVPAGGSPLASTVLMTVIPARVAGVEEVVVCAPPEDDGTMNEYVKAAVALAGADQVFAVGGVQAIAAVAHGTDTFPKVDKVVGPGNEYVNAAKMAVYGEVGIDLPAGPSEVLIVSDGSTDPTIVAADLLAQAEHRGGQPTLITTSETEKAAVEEELRDQLAALHARDEHSAVTARASLDANERIDVVEDVDAAMAVANEEAPEHLEILTADAEARLDDVRNAGTVFVGERSAEVLGDYTTGTNHVLPTGEAARYTDGLGVRDFLKSITFEKQTGESFAVLADAAKTLAEIEGLTAHGWSIKRREEHSE